MSNQEAIALLRNLEDSLDAYCELNEEGKTAFRMAIEALSSSEFPNSSDTDTISRQAAIEALGEKSDEIYKTKQKGATYPHDDFFQGMAYAENVVKQLPLIQPTDNLQKLADEIASFKRCVKSDNGDYLTGYLCALSVVEGMIADMRGE